MNGFYQRSYNQDELQRLHDENNTANMMGMMPLQNIPGAQSLDDIVNQNAKELRRRSMPLGYGQEQGDMDSTIRRVSMMDMHQMMEFGNSSPNGPLTGYQFDPSTSADLDRMNVDGAAADHEVAQSRRQSNADLSINTQFQSQTPYGTNDPSGTVYPSPMAISSALDTDMNSPYISSGMPSAISMNMDMHMMGNDMQGSDLFTTPQYHGSPLMESPMHQNSYNSILGSTHDPGGGGMGSKDAYPQIKDDNSTPEYLRNTSRTTSAENTTQSESRQGSGSAQPSGLSTPQVPYTSPKRPAPHTGPPETINGVVLPWAAPPGKSGRVPSV
jgi:hypothetical protein